MYLACWLLLWLIDIPAVYNDLFLSSLDSFHITFLYYDEIPQKRGFWVIFSMNPQNPMSKVYGVFSKRELTSTFVRQPAAITVDYILLGDIWTPQYKNLKADFLCLSSSVFAG